MEANGDSMTQEPPATVDAKHRRSRGCLVRADMRMLWSPTANAHRPRHALPISRLSPLCKPARVLSPRHLRQGLRAGDCHVAAYLEVQAGADEASVSDARHGSEQIARPAGNAANS